MPSRRTAPHRCTKTGLWLVPTAGRSAVRLARPSFGPLNPEQRPQRYSEEGKAWNRWDAPGARTIYAAGNEETSLGELFAYVAPKPDLLDLPLAEVFPESASVSDLVLGPATTLGDAVRAEWEEQHRIDPHAVVRNFRDTYRIYDLTLPATGWVIDIEHPDSIAAIDKASRSTLAKRGIERLTRAHLEGGDRALTVSIARAAHRAVLDDGSLAHGIQYLSKHGGTDPCWAIWLRRVDDGKPVSAEPTRQVACREIEPPARNEPLRNVARRFHLTVH